MTLVRRNTTQADKLGCENAKGFNTRSEQVAQGHRIFSAQHRFRGRDRTQPELNSQVPAHKKKRCKKRNTREKRHDQSRS